jgi:hypothetical protein
MLHNRPGFPKDQIQGGSQMTKPLPQVVRVSGHPRLMVDGEPFLILGLQWACESCFSVEEMNPLFSHAARMGCNTAVTPLYWREVEPQPGEFDFDMLDERLAQARANGLRLVLLWFATWKNAHAFYAPDDIQNESERYPRAHDRVGRPLRSLCPSSDGTWQRDRRALVAVMEHLREVDEARTVILFQLENEPGIMGSDRCYCPACNARFEAGDWEEEWGAHAAEAFSVASVQGYIDRLAAEAQAIYPIPLYVNVWLSGLAGSRPGRDYPSGGAVSHMLAFARQQLPHVDLIGPDIYRHGYRDFQRLCREYSSGDNPLYIAEHSSSPSGRAERNVFYAIGEHGALGFDPWAIDSPFPERTPPPMVDPAGGEWGPQAYALRDSYVAIGAAMGPVVETQGTDRLFAFVQEPGESVAGWKADSVDVLVTYRDRAEAGRGMVIRQAAGEFLALGVGFELSFRRPAPDGSEIRVRSVEHGRYEGQRWVALHPTPQGRTHFLEPSVVRIQLDIKEDE